MGAILDKIKSIFKKEKRTEASLVKEYEAKPLPELRLEGIITTIYNGKKIQKTFIVRKTPITKYGYNLNSIPTYTYIPYEYSMLEVGKRVMKSSKIQYEKEETLKRNVNDFTIYDNEIDVLVEFTKEEYGSLEEGLCLYAVLDGKEVKVTHGIHLPIVEVGKVESIKNEGVSA